MCTIENKDEFINFVKNAKLYHHEQLHIIFSQKPEIKHCFELQKQFNYTPLITDIQKIIIDYYTLDHTVPCECYTMHNDVGSISLCLVLYYHDVHIRIQLNVTWCHIFKYTSSNHDDDVSVIIDHLKSITKTNSK